MQSDVNFIKGSKCAEKSCNKVCLRINKGSNCFEKGEKQDEQVLTSDPINPSFAHKHASSDAATLQLLPAATVHVQIHSQNTTNNVSISTVHKIQMFLNTLKHTKRKCVRILTSSCSVRENELVRWLIVGHHHPSTKPRNIKTAKNYIHTGSLVKKVKPHHHLPRDLACSCECFIPGSRQTAWAIADCILS